MRKNILNWMKLSSFIFALSSLFASCSNELDETLQPVGNGNLQFVVSDFPAFDEGTATRAFGTPDAGKTAWAGGDMILVHFNSPKYGDQAVTLTFDSGNNTWTPDGGTLKYVENENPTITAVYAPDCEIKPDNTIGLKDNKRYGMAEYILANATISGTLLEISFESGRKYSRLRIVAEPLESLTISTITGFTPAGTSDSAPKEYTLTADVNGNAYLYGTFAASGTVEVKGKVTTPYTFTATTVAGKSYALDVRPLDVDLGLPSGTRWATRNVGADNPWDYGDYFAWGETSPKASYTWDNYTWGTQDNLTKYNSTDGITTLEAGDDAATANMGDDWKMPTKEQWEELIEQCTWTWETINGIKGQIVKSKTNNNSIFLPAQGFYLNSQNVVTEGHAYWSIDLSEELMKSYAIGFTQNGTVNESAFPQYRYLGMPIRAVKK